MTKPQEVQFGKIPAVPAPVVFGKIPAADHVVSSSPVDAHAPEPETEPEAADDAEDG